MSLWDAFDERADLDPRDLDRGATDGGEHCFVEAHYVKAEAPEARRSLSKGVYYLECRRGPGSEGGTGGVLFTREQTDLDRRTARHALWASRGTTAAYHGVILSPSRGLGLRTTEEMQQWTRQVLDELGRRLDRQLVYVGAIHNNTGRMHAHLLIAGRGQSSKGRPQNVRLTRADLAALRQITVTAARSISAATRKVERAERRAAQWDALNQRLGITNRKVG